MRLHGRTATIENGFVHVPRDAYWLNPYGRTIMEWKQTGDTCRAEVGEGYAVDTRELQGQRWFTLEYGEGYVGGNYTSLELAKHAAEAHHKAHEKRHGENKEPDSPKPEIDLEHAYVVIDGKRHKIIDVVKLVLERR
jgi:hypothetical protein